jgi:hypothetical protein
MITGMDTPEWFYRYFQSFATSDSPSSRDWTPGVQAAQLWKQYHDTNCTTPILVDEIIGILMPNRYAGSGFLALWQSVLHHVRELPVDIQIALWRHIFDSKNHGDRPIPGTQYAEVTLNLWSDTWIRSDKEGVDAEAVSAMVEALYPRLLATDEWRALLFAIDHWIQQIQPQRPLLDRVVDRYNAVNRAE